MADISLQAGLHQKAAKRSDYLHPFSLRASPRHITASKKASLYATAAFPHFSRKLNSIGDQMDIEPPIIVNLIIVTTWRVGDSPVINSRHQPKNHQTDLMRRAYNST